MRVFMLNGTSSAGKTTLAAALQERLAASGECAMTISPEDFLVRAPRAWMAYGRFHVGERSDQGLTFRIVDGQLTRRVGPVGAQIVAAYRSTVAAVARTGLSVIVDDVLFEKDDWLSWRQHLAGLDVVWVGLTVPLDVLEQRERERGDRVVGQARSQHALVHRHATYDVEVDTAALRPDAAAASILDAIGR